MMGTGRRSVIIQGLVHLLDRDGTALCGCPYGLLTSSAPRCTCATCVCILAKTSDEPHARPLVTGDAPDELEH